MIPLEEATAYVLERVGPLEAVERTPADALGCVVVEPVVSPEPVPPFENTAMDGYAVRATDTAGAPVELPVAGTLAAGADPASIAVAPGTAVRIMTGAAMPAGADAIVIVERTTPLDDGARVRIEAAASPGDHIRAPGTDIATGATVLAPGTVLREV
ncbi:MAG: molybdopterin molybdotransferase, partial [Acidimicrobiaceae bacterium]